MLMRQAREELIRLGVLEDSGERRPYPVGEMETVWRLSLLGHRVAEWCNRGLSFDEALETALASLSRPN
jgi:hypothetical protein